MFGDGQIFCRVFLVAAYDLRKGRYDMNYEFCDKFHTHKILFPYM